MRMVIYLRVCLWIPFVLCPQRPGEDSLELELQRVVNCFVGAENRIQVLWKSGPCF